VPARAREPRRATRIPPRAGVEARRRLVEEKNGRSVEKRLGDLDAARESAREGFDEVIASVREVERLEQLADADVARPTTSAYSAPWRTRFSVTESFLSRLGA